MRFSNLVLFLALFLALFLLMRVSAALCAEPVGRLTGVRGDVTINGKPAADNAPVSVGDVIESDFGKCTILLGQEHVIHLDTESKMRITQRLAENGRDDTLLDLSHGRTRALIRSETGKKRNFGIRARSAVMGVRGTHVYVESPRDLSLPQRFMTVEGLAQVNFISHVKGADPVRPDQTSTVPAPVVLQDGEMIESVEFSGQARAPAGAVAKLPPKEVKQLVQEIAPPPKQLKTIGDVKDVKKRPHDRLPGPRRPFPIAPGVQIPLDPVADNIAEVIISGEIIKK